MSFLLLSDGSSGGPQPLATTATGIAVVTGDLAVHRPLSGTISGTTTVPLAKANVLHTLAASVSGIAIVTAQFGGLRQLSASVSGLASVSSIAVVAKALKASPAGVATVTVDMFVEGIKATVIGISTVAAPLAVERRLQASVVGTSTVAGTAKKLAGLRAISNGLATVTGFINRSITRSAVSNLSIIAEYQRIVGILMLVDPAFQVELGSPPTAQTFNFVKKVVKGLFYVDIHVSGSTLTCQVKTGDGENYNQIVNVSVRTISTFVPPLLGAAITVTVGTPMAGGGTSAVWLQTTSTGAFALSIVGSGQVLVEALPMQGVFMSAGLNL